MSGTSAWLADHVASLLPKPVTSFLPQATAGACVGGGAWTSNGHECNGSNLLLLDQSLPFQLPRGRYLH